MNSVKRLLSNHLKNYRGWHTKRKIVVIESDDWGSICMPSTDIFKELIQKKYHLDQCPYATNDALASEEDLKRLFSILSEFRDFKENNPVITANTVVTNPDFDKIRESDFKKFAYELFTTSLARYPEHSGSFNLWKQGINSRLFYPQFHGREHVNIKSWLAELQDTTSDYRSVFDYNLCWLGYSNKMRNRISLRASFDTENLGDIPDQKTALREGLEIFESIFGYKSKSFIAPNYVYHTDLNEVLHDSGVRYIQGIKYQSHPVLLDSKRVLIRHYQGEKNQLGQYYLVRNCTFEPALYTKKHDNVGNCLTGIQNAFFWKRPAIITSHRLNYIGYIHPENRERNLIQLRLLLKEVLRRWPDVEFMTSAELGDLISASDATE